MSSKTEKTNRILTKTTPFEPWKNILISALADKAVLGHVFHDFEWEDAKVRPTLPEISATATQEERNTMNATYKTNLAAFMKGDYIARGIITERLATDLRPNFGGLDKTAKELYDTVAATFRPIITVDIHDTLGQIGNIKLSGSDTLKYCDEFNNWLQTH